MRTLLIAAVLVLGSGCASGGDPFDDGARPPEGVEIEVVNRHFNQAEIWALGFGGRRRLGIVPGKATETFTLPWAASGYLRLEMQILSSGTCFTDELDTDPGDLLYLEVPLEPRNDPSCRGSPLPIQASPTRTTIRSATFVPVGPVRIRSPVASSRG